MGLIFRMTKLIFLGERQRAGRVAFVFLDKLEGGVVIFRICVKKKEFSGENIVKSLENVIFEEMI